LVEAGVTVAGAVPPSAAQQRGAAAVSLERVVVVGGEHRPVDRLEGVVCERRTEVSDRQRVTSAHTPNLE